MFHWFRLLCSGSTLRACRLLVVVLVLFCAFPAMSQPAEPPRVIPPAPEEGEEPASPPKEEGKAEKGAPGAEAGKELPELPVEDQGQTQEGESPKEEGEQGESEGEEGEQETKVAASDCEAYQPGPTRTALVKQIDVILGSKQLAGAKMGVLAVTFPEGEVLYEKASTELFNPASVTKIFTSVAALLNLGTSKKYATRVYQEPETCGKLVVKGGGDPGLTSGRVTKLAKQVQKAGVTCVSEVEYDVSLFDGKNLPPAFDQQDGPDGYRAKVGALGMDYGAFWLNAYPTEPGQAARLETVPGTGCIQWENKAVTAASGEKVPTDKALAATVSQKGDKVFVVVKGRIPTNRKNGVSLSLAVPDPDWFTACYMAEQLKMQGVQVRSGKYDAGKAGKEWKVVGELVSNPLVTDVVEMSRNSRNYMAEQIVKLLSEGRCKRYSFSCGLKVVRQVMRQFHAGSECAKLKNGSGLFNANRVSPVATVRFLTEVLNHSELKGPFIKSLAQGHKSGTLKDRMKGVVLPVYAKTGTLDTVSALAGYIVRPDGGYVVFAIYFNGLNGSIKQRNAQDQVVGKLAEAVARKKGSGHSGKSGSEGKHRKQSKKSKHSKHKKSH